MVESTGVSTQRLKAVGPSLQLKRNIPPLPCWKMLSVRFGNIKQRYRVQGWRSIYIFPHVLFLNILHMLHFAVPFILFNPCSLVIRIPYPLSKRSLAEQAGRTAIELDVDIS